jgi:hypothetical protein
MQYNNIKYVFLRIGKTRITILGSILIIRFNVKLLSIKYLGLYMKFPKF